MKIYKKVAVDIQFGYVSNESISINIALSPDSPRSFRTYFRILELSGKSKTCVQEITYA